MKKILLIATGGTIASKYTAEGLAPQISADELLEYIPEAREFCTIDTVQPFALDSTNVCADHWLKLARLIESKYEFYDVQISGAERQDHDAGHGQGHPRGRQCLHL